MVLIASVDNNTKNKSVGTDEADDLTKTIRSIERKKSAILADGLHQQSEQKIDMDPQAVYRYWISRDQRLAEILITLESSEDWLISESDEQVNDAVKSLFENIEQKGKFVLINKLSYELFYILAYLSIGRAVRFIEWLDAKYSGMGLRLIQKAVHLVNKVNNVDEDSEYREITEEEERVYIEAMLLINRIDVINRLNHLNRIFDSSRIRLVKKAVDSVEGDF